VAPRTPVPRNPSPQLVAYACVACRRSFKRPQPQGQPTDRVCPSCGELAVNVGRHFKPPRRASLKQWEKVAFLIANGFLFQHIYDRESDRALVPYPRDLKAAHEFVRKYRNQAWRRPRGRRTRG
jgi:hypothetical protein